MPIDFLEELRWRGLLHQCTDEPGLREHLDSGVRRAYAGFDPTADSLTIGNLVPIMLLIHFRRAGHEPVVVMGGGTGLIGDPSGKSAERTLMTEDRVRSNVRAINPIFERVFGNAGLPPPRILNNLDWLGKLGYLEALRDVGKHFSVNMMIQKDSVRERLHARDQGISYTEFSYMILQAYDYLRLRRDHSVTLQMGGSDQWGNIVAGADLIRRDAADSVWGQAEFTPPIAVSQLHDAKSGQFVEAAMAFGLTAPLVTKSDGGKFGKTEGGAVWLTPERTTPYAFHQFWLNMPDADIGRYLRMFTLMDREQIEQAERAHAENPAARTAQHLLARQVTSLLHGMHAAHEAETAARALFARSSGVLNDFDSTLAALRDVPACDIDRVALDAGIPVLDAIANTPLAASKREAREHLRAGAISVNGVPVGIDAVLTTQHLLKGDVIAVRRGKKTWLLLRARERPSDVL
jgi:tyrosyl-tRNA synthetase